LFRYDVVISGPMLGFGWKFRYAPGREYRTVQSVLEAAAKDPTIKETLILEGLWTPPGVTRAN
jgi:hypothetical protein